jgi:hypothetical protein
MTRDTVAIETPASSATCLIVIRAGRRPSALITSTAALKHVPETDPPTDADYPRRRPLNSYSVTPLLPVAPATLCPS